MKKLIASYGAGEAVAKGLNVALVLGLAAFVDVNSYGVIAILVAVELVVTELLILGQHTAMLRFHEFFKTDISRLYSASVAIILTATVATFVLYAMLPLREWQLLSPHLLNSDILCLIAAAGFQSHFALYLAYLRAANCPGRYVQMRVSYQVVKLAFVSGGLLITREPSVYAVGVLAASAMFLLLVPSINRQTRGYEGIASVSSAIVRQNLLIGLPLTAHTLIGVLNATVDKFFLQKMLDHEQVAIYNFAFVQGSAIFFALNVLALVYVPKIYRGQEFNSETRQLLGEFLRNAMLGAAVLALVVYFVVYPISLTFVVPQYREGASVVLLALAIVILHPLSLYGLYKLTLLKKVYGVPLVTLGCLGCNMALNTMLIPRHGIEGAAASLLISEGLYGVTMMSLAHVMERRSRTH